MAGTDIDREGAVQSRGGNSRSSLGGARDNSRDRLEEDEAAKRARKFGINLTPPDVANLKPGQGYHSLSGMERLWAGIKGLFGGVQAAGQVAAGGPAGILAGGLSGKRSINNLRAAASGVQYTDENGKNMGAPNLGETPSGDVSEGSKSMGVGGLIPSVRAALPSPVSNVFDYFTSKSRKKQGYQSTILGGGLGSVPPPKTLLGE